MDWRASLLKMSMVAALVMSVASPVIAQSAAVPADWQVTSTSRPVPVVVASLKSRLAGGKARIMAVIDHAANARSIGRTMPDTVLVLFGNPAVGGPLMAKNRAFGLDLPVHMLVWREGELTRIGYEKPEALARRYGVASDDEAIRGMTTTLDTLTRSLVTP